MTAVGAALKRILVTLLTDKKGRKFLLYTVLTVLVVIITPILALAAFLNSGFTLDRDRLIQSVTANISAGQQERFQQINSISNDVDYAMRNAGFASRVNEAQVLLMLALSEHMYESGFPIRLANCFAEDQTDAQLVAAVNAEFGTKVQAEDFTRVMAGLRAVYIDTSRYTDPSTKNNLDLVQYAKEAERSGWGYVWGTYGLVLTEARFNSKLEQYPDDIGEHEEFIREHWIGRRTADCAGFIKGYGWLNSETREIEYGTNDFPDHSADGMHNAAAEKGSIDTIPEIPGLAVWYGGHIGIYIGNGEVIEAQSTHSGVVKTKLSDAGWVDWLMIPGITYTEETVKPSPTETNETEVP